MNIDTRQGDAQLVRFLQNRGLLSSDAVKIVNEALASPEERRPVVEIVVQSGLSSEEEIAQVLGDGLRLPIVNLPALALDSAATGIVREDLVTRYNIMPIRVQDNVLTVAAVNPLDRNGLRAIEFATSKTVRVQVATLTAVRDAIQHAYHLEDALNAYLDGVPPATDTPVAELEEASDLSTLVRGTQLPPVVKLLNLILVDGVRAGASDVHIEASLSEVRVRYRIDGVLHESFRLPKWVEDPLTARCKVLASLDITERRLPQDGRIRIRYQEKMFDVRVSSLPTQFGEKVTMRILDPNSGPKSLESLNLQSRDRSEPEITYVAKPVPQPRPRPSVEANRPIEVARTLETPPIEAPRVVETPPAAPQAAPLSEGEGAANGSRRFRALIIDDERDFRYLVKVFLEHSGIPIEVEMASNGREGIDKARANLPDIVLLDIMMPEMDGFEVCKMLRADVHTAFVPILMLTALDDSASRTRGFMAGTDDYISKPFDRRELLARFRRVLGRTYGVGMPEGTPREDTENLTAEPMEEAPAL